MRVAKSNRTTTSSLAAPLKCVLLPSIDAMTAIDQRDFSTLRTDTRQLLVSQDARLPAPLTQVMEELQVSRVDLTWTEAETDERIKKAVEPLKTIVSDRDVPVVARVGEDVVAKRVDRDAAASRARSEWLLDFEESSPLLTSWGPVLWTSKGPVFLQDYGGEDLVDGLLDDGLDLKRFVKLLLHLAQAAVKMEKCGVVHGNIERCEIMSKDGSSFRLGGFTQARLASDEAGGKTATESDVQLCAGIISEAVSYNNDGAAFLEDLRYHLPELPETVNAVAAVLDDMAGASLTPEQFLSGATKVQTAFEQEMARLGDAGNAAASRYFVHPYGETEGITQARLESDEADGATATESDMQLGAAAFLQDLRNRLPELPETVNAVAAVLDDMAGASPTREQFLSGATKVQTAFEQEMARLGDDGSDTE